MSYKYKNRIESIIRKCDKYNAVFSHEFVGEQLRVELNPNFNFFGDDNAPSRIFVSSNESLANNLKSNIFLTYKPKDINHVTGKRWFDSLYGNTYHTAIIHFKDGNSLKMPMRYGYGDHYLTEASNYLKGLECEVDLYSWEVRDDLGITISVSDVARKRDL